MPLYEIVVEAIYRGQQIINRWNYLLTGTPASVTGSFGLVSAMGFVSAAGAYPSPSFFAQMREVNNGGVNYVQVVCNNVYDVTDFYSTPFLPNTFGLHNDGDEMSPFLAYGFHSNQVRRDIRRGQKRMTGVSEGSVDAGGALDAQMQGECNELAQMMTDTQVYDDEGQNLNYQPCIVGKQKYTPSGSTKDAYRYYPTFAEQADHLALGVIWTALTFITTQNSRKVGRGS